jgi:hypothetical protein
MKSYIKKNDILDYILSKFNDSNATQDVNFIMGSEGMPLYKPISVEGANGNPDEFEFFDNSTYELTKSQAIALSIPIIDADYANLKTIDGTKKLNSATWSVGISFLVYANSYVHNKLVFAIEEFRDKILGQTDILNIKQWDYSSVSTVPAWTHYTVVAASGDLNPGGLMTINGDIFMEYTLTIDLDISEGVDYGNQYEFYLSNDSHTTPERLLPIQVSWAVSNSLKANQLLRNASVLADTSVSIHTKNKYKAIHNLIETKGFSINMTLIKTQDSSSIIEDLFEETYALYDVMNKPYKLTMKYKPIVGNAGNKTFGTAVEKFSYNMIVMEATTEVVHGDDITFNIVMVSSWNEVS